MTNAIYINIPEDLVTQIDSRAGKRGRSAFIRRAVRAALKTSTIDDDMHVPLAADVQEPKPAPEKPATNGKPKEQWTRDDFIKEFGFDPETNENVKIQEETDDDEEADA